MHGLPHLVKAALDLLLPPRCLLCGRFLLGECRALCSDCLQAIEYIGSPVCRCCGMEVSGEADRRQLCGSCLRHPPPFKRAMAVIHYDQPASQLLHRLKYSGDTTVLPGLARIIETVVMPEIPSSAIIIPVPLYRQRLRKRGLNQAVLLSRLFFPTRIKDIRTDILLRVRDTPPQTSLNGDARRKNLRSAFIVSENNLLHGRSVCLVDDVFTTGTTVAECAKSLIEKGAEEVQVLTFARVIAKR
jgi:ComF family protein